MTGEKGGYVMMDSTPEIGTRLAIISGQSRGLFSLFSSSALSICSLYLPSSLFALLSAVCPLLSAQPWGSLCDGAVFLIIAFVGIDGIKMLSNLGGVPALFIVIAATASLLRLVSIGTAKIGLEHTPSRSYSPEAHLCWESTRKTAESSR